jgi:hypothetical protein
VNALRKRKKQKDKFRDEQLDLLREENELLRLRIIQLREDVYALFWVLIGGKSHENN